MLQMVFPICNPNVSETSRMWSFRLNQKQRVRLRWKLTWARMMVKYVKAQISRRPTRRPLNRSNPEKAARVVDHPRALEARRRRGTRRRQNVSVTTLFIKLRQSITKKRCLEECPKDHTAEAAVRQESRPTSTKLAYFHQKAHQFTSVGDVKGMSFVTCAGIIPRLLNGPMNHFGTCTVSTTSKCRPLLSIFL